MKTWLLAILLVAPVAFAERPPIRDVSEFYEPLSAHGYWVQHARGWCWAPERVAPDWRPFSAGHWLWTPNGWYWESPEPWAWATYHYGRWFWDEREGWLWLPDTEWVPASPVEARVPAAPPPAPVVQYYRYVERIEPAPIWYFHIERRTDCCRVRPCDRHRPRPRCDPPPRPRCDNSTPRPPAQPAPQPPPRTELTAPAPRPSPAPRPVVTERIETKKTLPPQTIAYRERVAERRAEKLAKNRD